MCITTAMCPSYIVQGKIVQGNIVQGNIVKGNIVKGNTLKGNIVKRNIVKARPRLNIYPKYVYNGTFINERLIY